MNVEEIQKQAIDFAKKNKVRIAKDLTDTTRYKPDKKPISVFLAGSPGAGKTEFSKNLIETLEKNLERRVVRIDGDEIRYFLPGYTGNNSSLFQYAVSLIVEKMHDLVLHQKQTFVLDGTFTNYEKAKGNIERSLAKGRLVLIFYVYQKPEVAWSFTVAREKQEGRNIPKDVFIKQFFGAKYVVGRIRQEFGQEIVIFLVKKDFQTHMVEYVKEIVQGDQGIDQYFRERYTKEDLEKLL
jgi:UDP-N-acetylglucosamine kinase